MVFDVRYDKNKHLDRIQMESDLRALKAVATSDAVVLFQTAAFAKVGFVAAGISSIFSIVALIVARRGLREVVSVERSAPEGAGPGST